MSFSYLMNIICRGQWFLSARELDTLYPTIQNMLEGRGKIYDNTLFSERNPLKSTFMSLSLDSKAKADTGSTYSNAPKGSVALVSLNGTMTKNGTWCNYGTAEIASQIREAADADTICAIVLAIDSGGGCVDSIAPMRDAIQYAQSKRKPVVACCDLCASAAYYAASYCNEIMADNDISSEFGSIGVMVSLPDYSGKNQMEGVKLHEIYSTLSTDKNKSYHNALAGSYEAIQAETLDPLAQGFQNQVKSARKNLNQECDGVLSGKMFFAQDALNNGLIDSVGGLNLAVSHAKQLSIDMLMTQFINTIK